MKQVLHIFAKDTRHFWPEILASLAVTAVFALVYPYRWADGLSLTAGGTRNYEAMLILIASILSLLVPVAWWILIARVIHDENLVGDRQFWLTRPYEWSTLLAAKFLFLLIFLYLPIFLAQCALLAQGGFHPLSYLPGLLFNLLLITAILVLPLVSIAAVTSTFAKMTLTLLAVLLGMLAVAITSSMKGANGSIKFIGDSDSSGGLWWIAVLLCLCAAAVVLQYSTRKLWQSRLVLLAFPLAVVAVHVAIPDSVVVNSRYPRLTSAQNLPAPATFAIEPSGVGMAVILYNGVGFNIPIQASGVAENQAVRMEYFKISIDAANGTHWTSPWQKANNSPTFLHGLPWTGVDVTVDKTFFDQVKSLPVTLHLTFALSQLQSGTVNRIVFPGSSFAVPGIGVCSPDAGESYRYAEGLTCRSALHQPRLTYVSTPWSDTECSATTAPSPLLRSENWVGTLDSVPADFGISSVRDHSAYLNSWSGRSDGHQKPNHLCPGTPITFTEYNLVKRFQSDLVVPNFHLPAYIPGQPVSVPSPFVM